MREILFRGKSLTTGKWIQGYLFRCWERAYIAWGMVNDNADMKEVDSETVCQYTGLTDKNGRKIFEGDILRSDDSKIGQVQWFEEHSAFMIWNNTENKVHFLYDNNFSRIEAAGNVFDNPQLVENNA